jgi:FAD:protein FMN transferase
VGRRGGRTIGTIAHCGRPGSGRASAVGSPGDRGPNPRADVAAGHDSSHDVRPAAASTPAARDRWELMAAAAGFSTEPWTDTTFPSMGSTARLLIRGGPADLPVIARARLDELEARWSRFRPTSELCRMNRAGGAPVLVSHDTYDVVALAVGSWQATDGRFDPTLIDALEQAGYDRDFAAICDADTAHGAAPHASAGCGDIELLPLVPAVRLPAGVRLDLGGIGKGRAADVLAAELRGAGADGVCVNLGGDVRVSGTPPVPPGWQVDLDPTLAPGRSFHLDDGAVATSTRLRRAWTRDGERRHHLLDPSDGRPAWSGLASVTVLARNAAHAEVLAKAAFVAGPEAGRDLLRAAEVTGLFVHDDGRVEDLPGLAPFLR